MRVRRLRAALLCRVCRRRTGSLWSSGSARTRRTASGRGAMCLATCLLTCRARRALMEHAAASSTALRIPRGPAHLQRRAAAPGASCSTPRTTCAIPCVCADRAATPMRRSAHRRTHTETQRCRCLIKRQIYPACCMRGRKPRPATRPRSPAKSARTCFCNAADFGQVSHTSACAWARVRSCAPVGWRRLVCCTCALYTRVHALHDVP